MSNNSIFATALMSNHAVKSRKEATINGGQVGVENYAKWKVAMTKAHEAFYTYQHDVVDVAIAKNPTADTTRAMNALQELLDLVGEVNGHGIAKNPEMLIMVSKYAEKDVSQLAGPAMTVASELKNLKAEYAEIGNGVNPEYVENLEKAIAEKEAELKLEKAKTGSAKKFKGRTKFASFCYGVETALAEICIGQSAKTWEELEAEDEARRKARRETTKAKKKAKKEAEAKAKAEAENKAECDTVQALPHELEI